MSLKRFRSLPVLVAQGTLANEASDKTWSPSSTRSTRASNNRPKERGPAALAAGPIHLNGSGNYLPNTFMAFLTARSLSHVTIAFSAALQTLNSLAWVSRSL